MNFFKKTLSVILVVVLIVTSAISAFAQESNVDVTAYDEQDLSYQTMKLYDYSVDYLRTFYLYEELAFRFALRCDVPSGNELCEVINEVSNFEEDVYYGKETSIEEINEYYKRLDDAAKKVIILNDELKFLIDFCKLEKNDNSYYPADIWEKFQSKLSVAELIYNKGEDTIEVSNAYWDLFFTYNELCIVNTTSGDVDFDGQVTILDATLIQLQLADLYVLNSSQLIVLDEGSKDDVTVLKATELQQYIARLVSDLSDVCLSNVMKNVHRMDSRDNPVFRDYRFIYMY